MPRAYPPIWCKNDNCKKCNFLECHSKSLGLFLPYKYRNLDFSKRPKVIEITSIAIYLGFCQRLAKFFLLFPQDAPIACVRDNFVNNETGKPTTVSIQRILLDMLNHGDPEAPTDEVHKLRMFFMLKASNKKIGHIADAQKDIAVKPSEREMNDFVKKVKSFQADLVSGKITDFKKTNRLDRCKYCFLEDCEQI
jgi:hypothetical protein